MCNEIVRQSGQTVSLMLSTVESKYKDYHRKTSISSGFNVEILLSYNVLSKISQNIC